MNTPSPFDPALVQIVRKRFSTTQGETLVRYNETTLEQYGDDPVLEKDGFYRQKPDSYWIEVAEREAVARGLTSPAPVAEDPLAEALRLLNAVLSIGEHDSDGDFILYTQEGEDSPELVREIDDFVAKQNAA